MPVHRPPTQKQIAAVLGVSQALVSRALSGRAAQIGASPRTVARIRRLAAKRGYQPHAAALALLGAPTRVLGVVVKDFEDPYFGRLIGCLQETARRRGISLLLTGRDGDDVAALQRHRVDGVILAGSDFRPEGLRRCVGPDTPMVQLGTGAPHPGATLIGMDEGAGIASLVDYLSSQGHRCIAFAGLEAPAHRRREGFVRSASRGRAVRGRFFRAPDASVLVRQIASACHGSDRRPTAIIAGDDLLALGLMAGLASGGVTVPKALSLAGIDDIPAASFALPSLTTLAHPMPEMAAAAMDILAAPREDRPSAPRLFPGRLVIRASCASLRS